MMDIKRSIDIEDEIRVALKNHLTIYCRPLPKDFSLPCILVTQVGGDDENSEIDTFDVVLDARATSAAEANELLRNAVGILRKVTKDQTTALRYIEVNSSGSWGSDPVRPELQMYSARIRAVAHLEQITI